MYKVVNSFQDKDGQLYQVGDVYPVEGKKLPNQQRLKILSSTDNDYKLVFIKKQEK